MSSEVETSLNVSVLGKLATTGRLFEALAVYHDTDSRSAPLNMAIDEALLEAATEPTIRFYRWNHPALSFGYFGKFADVEKDQDERDIVRRWTGGGIVFHGEDLTYSVVIPVTDPAFAESPTSIYEKVHAAIREALMMDGQSVELAASEAPKISDSCFANPVRADVLANGRKIAGAAQHRTRRGLLQQGSIQDVDLAGDFQEKFASELSNSCREQTICHRILERAKEIAGQKYAAAAWLRRR